MKIYDIFEQKLFEAGYEAISDFLDYDYPEDEDCDVTSNRIQKRYDEMSVEDFDEEFKKVVEGLIAYNINWDIDMDEVYEKLDEMTAKEASKALGVPYETYANMTTEERHDYAYDSFRHNRSDLEEFMELPEEVRLPKELVDEDDISDWLSDEYGYCHEGYNLKAVG